MWDLAFYTFIALLAVGNTIYRGRRREYRELALWYALVAILLGGKLGIAHAPFEWVDVIFVASCAGLVAWYFATRRVRRSRAV